MFRVHSPFEPTGDQPQAVEKLSRHLSDNVADTILLGVTGSGKTATMSWAIEKTQKPAIIISPNKTLAAQLFQECKQFFPENSVHYFVSYYDYYQPEAYIPQTDTYIEKDAKVNQVIDQLRHSAVQSLTERTDNIVVASVSCIYGIGSPEIYERAQLELKQGQTITRKDFTKRLVALQYQRNNIDFRPGTFRVQGEVFDIHLTTGEAVRIEFFGDTIERITHYKDALNPKTNTQHESFILHPGQFWVTEEGKLQLAIENIRTELAERLTVLEKGGKIVEAQRLEQRTNYDLEMLEEAGWCHGIENYSRHLEFREPDTAPFTLLDYFKKNFVCFIDESHLTCSQLKAMHVQDQARKKMLIDHGFRLPSAADNRPLSYEEFADRTPQKVYVSATPSMFERSHTKPEHIVEQLVRPTGLTEPDIEIRPTHGQVQDLVEEAKKHIAKGQRVFAITLTKRLAEALAERLIEEGIKAHYLHSEVKTLERPEILKKLRQGAYDALVGINLLREGLDIPEVSLVAILDADKEGFLRSETTLVQTMGRAARHIEGRAILYADHTTGSMQRAIDEVNRRRAYQEQYNKENDITPHPITKDLLDWEHTIKNKEIETEFGFVQDIKQLTKEMNQAAKDLDFERAAVLRDMINQLEKEKS